MWEGGATAISAALGTVKADKLPWIKNLDKVDQDVLKSSAGVLGGLLGQAEEKVNDRRGYRPDMVEAPYNVNPLYLRLVPRDQNAERYCTILSAEIGQPPGVRVRDLIGLVTDYRDSARQPRNMVIAEFRLEYGDKRDGASRIRFHLCPYPVIAGPKDAPATMQFPNSYAQAHFSYEVDLDLAYYYYYDYTCDPPHRWEFNEVWEVESGFEGPLSVRWHHESHRHLPSLVGDILGPDSPRREPGQYYPYLTLKPKQGSDTGKRYDFTINLGDTQVIIE